MRLPCFILLTLAFSWTAGHGNPPPASNDSVGSAANTAEPVWKEHLPFLQPGKLQGDPLFFVQTEGEPVAKTLLLKVPDSVPELHSATMEKRYESGKDFTWKEGGREIVLTPDSTIPFRKAAELHPAPNSANSYNGYRDGKSWMLFGEGRFFHDLQSSASYASKEVWQGPVPRAAPNDQLGKLREKLRRRQSIRLVTLGDSISTGANASGHAAAPPLLMGYHDLVARGLEKQFGVTVVDRNLSVGGMDSAWGLGQIPAVLTETPDLVVVAFGMNDASAGRSVEQFLKITGEIRDRVQTARPGCSVILVSPMTANPEWTHARPDLYPAYAAGLATLAGADCALADVTALWTAVLGKKTYLSLSGNGLNHPNDFGHRLYAGVVLALIGE